VGDAAKALIVAGVFLVAFGLLIALFGKIPGVGKLPGDIVFRRGSFTFYFPVTTSILISLIVSALFFFLGGRK
jgi:hypothetical protein